MSFSWPHYTHTKNFQWVVELLCSRLQTLMSWKWPLLLPIMFGKVPASPLIGCVTKLALMGFLASYPTYLAVAWLFHSTFCSIMEILSLTAARFAHVHCWFHILTLWAVVTNLMSWLALRLQFWFTGRSHEFGQIWESSRESPHTHITFFTTLSKCPYFFETSQVSIFCMTKKMPTTVLKANCMCPLPLGLTWGYCQQQLVNQVCCCIRTENEKEKKEANCMFSEDTQLQTPVHVSCQALEPKLHTDHALHLEKWDPGHFI